MKKSNKIISLLSAGCIALMSVAPICTSAQENEFSNTENPCVNCERPEFSYHSNRDFEKDFSHFEKFNPDNNGNHNFCGNNMDMFWNNESPENVHAVENVGNYVRCVLKENVTEEDLEKALEKFNKKHGKKYQCHKNSEKHGFKHKWDKYPDEEVPTEPETEITTEPETEVNTEYEFDITINGTDISFTMSDAKELYDFLKEEGLIEEFVYNSDASKIYTYASSVLDYYCVDYDSSLLYESAETVQSLISTFISLKGADCTVQYIDNMFQIITNGDIDIEERLAFAEEIYDNLGLYPLLDISCKEVAVYADSADMVNAVKNDANADGTVSIADSVSVLRSICNPDEFTLSKQGEYNCDTEMKGITAINALNIQEELIKS